jgi:hypothetical protein
LGSVELTQGTSHRKYYDPTINFKRDIWALVLKNLNFKILVQVQILGPGLTFTHERAEPIGLYLPSNRLFLRAKHVAETIGAR